MFTALIKLLQLCVFYSFYLCFDMILDNGNGSAQTFWQKLKVLVACIISPPAFDSLFDRQICLNYSFPISLPIYFYSHYLQQPFREYQETTIHFSILIIKLLYLSVKAPS